VPFLALNGWTVPVVPGGGRQPVIVGDDGRSFAGTLMRDRRVIKDRWRFTSSIQQAIDALALRGLLLGLGHNWRWDGDLYSGKGLVPLSSTVGIRWGIAGDGALVNDFGSSESESLLGSAGSLDPFPSTQNNLSGDSSDAENAPTGYAAVVSGVLAADTSNYVEGTKSLKVTAAASGDGAKTDAVSVDSAADYTGVVYLKGDAGAEAVTVRLYDDIGLVSSQNATLTATQWTRVEVLGTTNGAAATGYIDVVSNDGSAIVFYADAWALERQAVGSAWVRGGSVRAATDLLFSPSFLTKHRSFTISCWVRLPSASGTTTIASLRGGTDLTNHIKLERTNNGFTAKVYNTAGSLVASLAGDTGLADDAWHHVALAYYQTDASTAAVYLYEDGVLADSDTSAAALDSSSFTKLWLGNDNGATQFAGLIGPMLVVPFAAPAAMVLAWKNEQTTAFPDLPGLRASGGAVDGDSYTVEGDLKDANFLGYSDGGAWVNNAQRTQFELMEA
jgi:hypothetical protein